MSANGIISSEFNVKIYDGGPNNNNIWNPPDNIESLRLYREYRNVPDFDRDCEWPYGIIRPDPHCNKVVDHQELHTLETKKRTNR